MDILYAIPCKLYPMQSDLSPPCLPPKRSKHMHGNIIIVQMRIRSCVNKAGSERLQDMGHEQHLQPLFAVR
jgi:hypothetical protein